MSEDKLGEKPEPTTETGEHVPGGADAVEDNQPETDPITPDLPPEMNPALDDVVPDEITEGEDTDTAATRGEDVDDSEESPA